MSRRARAQEAAVPAAQAWKKTHPARGSVVGGGAGREGGVGQRGGEWR